MRANQALWWCGCTHIWDIPDISINLKTECHVFLAFHGHAQQMLEGTIIEFQDGRLLHDENEFIIHNFFCLMPFMISIPAVPFL
jgi:hypothetical protein